MPAASIPADRPLTSIEANLVRWLLEHGCTGAAELAPQVEQARVISHCSCGCASVNFSIDGQVPPVGAMNVLADYEYQSVEGHKFGVFVFGRGGLLAGLDVYSQDGRSTPSVLPEIEQLRPLGSLDAAE